MCMFWSEKGDPLTPNIWKLAISMFSPELWLFEYLNAGKVIHMLHLMRNTIASCLCSDWNRLFLLHMKQEYYDTLTTQGWIAIALGTLPNLSSGQNSLWSHKDFKLTNCPECMSLAQREMLSHTCAGSESKWLYIGSCSINAIIIYFHDSSETSFVEKIIQLHCQPWSLLLHPRPRGSADLSQFIKLVLSTESWVVRAKLQGHWFDYPHLTGNKFKHIWSSCKLLWCQLLAFQAITFNTDSRKQQLLPMKLQEMIEIGDLPTTFHAFAQGSSGMGGWGKGGGTNIP